MSRKNNIVLIGMPGAGKSTCGVLLARLTGLGFVDTDILIQAAEGRALQAIVDREGYLALRAIEERVILGLGPRGLVIATGGSAVYSARAMKFLRWRGVTVFLEVPLASIAGRIGDAASRGIACPPGMGLRELYAERVPLYEQYADVRVDTAGLGHEQVCRRVLASLARAGFAVDAFRRPALAGTDRPNGDVRRNAALVHCQRACSGVESPQATGRRLFRRSASARG